MTEKKIRQIAREEAKADRLEFIKLIIELIQLAKEVEKPYDPLEKFPKNWGRVNGKKF